MAKKISKAESRAKRLSKARLKENCAPLLTEALRLLRRGNGDRALRLATEALGIAASPEQESAARAVAAEVHFRAAMQSRPDQRLSRLEAALAIQPDDARLRYHRALALWRTGRLAEALPELDSVAESDPRRPGLQVLRQLARLGLGQKWSSDGLSAEERAFLEGMQAIVRGTEGEPCPGPHWQALAQMRGERVAAPTVLLQEAISVAKEPAAVAVLSYYQGIAALRQGDNLAARNLLLDAQRAGFETPWLAANLAALLRERAVALAAEGRWQEVADLAKLARTADDDRVLSETIGLAFFHLGYQAVQANQWQRAAEQWRQASNWNSSRLLAQNLALAEEALQNWRAAAEAWREMVRRRPRSASHPDFLDNNQVAAIWRHAGQCYSKADELDEAISCLKTALKYAENDTEIRLELANLLLENDQEEAASNEVRRLLELEPENVEALMMLGTLQLGSWGVDSIPLWKRALAVEPERVEARDGLAAAYFDKFRWMSFLEPQRREALIQEAMETLGDYPPFLLRLADLQRQLGQEAAALDSLLRAYRAAPRDVQTAGPVLHELLHLQAGPERVPELVQEIRQNPTLLPDFWISQGEQALACEFDSQWVQLFLDEAIALAGSTHVRASQTRLLMEAYYLLGPEGRDELRGHYASRIRNEAQGSGAMEFVQAMDAYASGDNRRGRRLLKAAKRLVQRASVPDVVEFIEEIESAMEMRASGLLDPDLLQRLMQMFPGGPPSPEELENLPDEFFEGFL